MLKDGCPHPHPSPGERRELSCHTWLRSTQGRCPVSSVQTGAAMCTLPVPRGQFFLFFSVDFKKKLDKRFTRVETPRNCWIYSVPPTSIFQVMEEEWSPAVTTFPAPPNSTCIEASFPWVSRFIVPQNHILALAFYPFKSMEPGLSADIYFLFPLL